MRARHAAFAASPQAAPSAAPTRTSEGWCAFTYSRLAHISTAAVHHTGVMPGRASDRAIAAATDMAAWLEGNDGDDGSSIRAPAAAGRCRRD